MNRNGKCGKKRNSAARNEAFFNNRKQNKSQENKLRTNLAYAEVVEKSSDLKKKLLITVMMKKLYI